MPIGTATGLGSMSARTLKSPRRGTEDFISVCANSEVFKTDLMGTRAGNFYIGLPAIKNPVMSIQSIKSLASSVPATPMDAKASPLSKPFVRNAMAGKTSNVAPASAKDSDPLSHWKHEVFQACEKLGLKPGEEKILFIDGKLMVIRRTETADAHVLQTFEESVHAPLKGLHLKDNLEMRYNTTLVGRNCSDKEAMQQLHKLGKALGVPHGGSGHEVGISVL